MYNNPEKELTAPGSSTQGPRLGGPVSEAVAKPPGGQQPGLPGMDHSSSGSEEAGYKDLAFGSLGSRGKLKSISEMGKTAERCWVPRF